ncbi:protein-L-isoaspartate(D-aspartate) O-methyltransferase [Lysobacter sp. HDW10]|uniref:protein-L-isoaspartate(D-aspartate) O-methyltransferase n=1 Tax=Lysobacter sp. HDW10 TaxID=2714936 RepID=UPI00140C2E95|nr:protein-L-isoaspartate(D-aspartate) O-methyltransferase [Lysobacter sp. HDW10]QIK81919.1 protein-L-isoaspartate(D-aspartate) O-methyltransferase [Lysobacter sp. HDW10]
MIGRTLHSSGVGFTSQRVRDRLVERLREQGIRNPYVLQAIGSVPRHLFIDEVLASRAYEDSALPIGFGQTISQPWVVARMTELILEGDTVPKHVLEIGTGSGYQAAVLAALGMQVHTVERIGELLRTARKRFRAQGITLRSKHDDGHIGWAEEGPFDAIMVTAGAQAIVEGLIDQLAPGGTLVAPVGGGATQALVRIRKLADGSLDIKEMEPVMFVPLLPGVVDQ